MPHEIMLRFRLPPSLGRVLQYFDSRPHFSIQGDEIEYHNQHTGVFFFLTCDVAAFPVLGQRVRSIRFIINYGRAGFFALESEQVLAKIVKAFQPRIEDDQIEGMGYGRYSSDGFIRGWEFGNLLMARFLIKGDDHFAKFRRRILPRERLLQAWRWNLETDPDWPKVEGHHRPRLMCAGETEDGFKMGVVWPFRLPVALPRADYVILQRDEADESRFHRIGWTDLVEVLDRAGLPTQGDPINLTHDHPPQSLLDWVDSLTWVGWDDVRALSLCKMIDAETIEAARLGIWMWGS